MKKFTLLLLLLLALFSCHKEDSFEFHEYSTYAYPIFVGNDSIFYIEYYTKVKETVGLFDSEIETSETDVRFKLMDSNGQEISTIWQLSSADDLESGFNICLALNYSNQSKTLMISYSPSFNSYEYQLMVMDLQGNLIRNFRDDDLGYASGYNTPNFPVSPNGAYYVLYNEIKNTAGEVVKILADTIMDWNERGLLVKNQSIDSSRIEIEGNEYDVFSHPDAQIWHGEGGQYLAFDQDTIKICKWSDSSVLKKLIVGPYQSYSPYGYLGYCPDCFRCSSLSPNLKYMVYEASEINLVDMETGELIMVLSPFYAYDSE
ncbi:hypothetical protein [Draconibacterium sediminis]|uniref:hypothetical protein n=1 Tax=Draconibacterium sediminis TaxID=1544798 RepID=UPI0026E92DA2|nr:hypothetical protein [Draconibacterium sediminis]